jgi:hypothetical protein
MIVFSGCASAPVIDQSLEHKALNGSYSLQVFYLQIPNGSFFSRHHFK